jgi:hypothetical protein
MFFFLLMHQISGDTHIGKVICKRHKVAKKKKNNMQG